MFQTSKQIVCPRCGKILGYRQEEYRREEKPLWGETDLITADFICSSCRKIMEEEIRERARNKEE